MPLRLISQISLELLPEIFFFSIFFVQNAVLLMSQPDASKAVLGAVHAVTAIEEVRNVLPAGFREDDVVEVMSGEVVLQSELARDAPSVAVVAILTLVHPHAELTVFDIRDVKGLVDVLAEGYVVAAHVLVPVPGEEFMRE